MVELTARREMHGPRCCGWAALTCCILLARHADAQNFLGANPAWLECAEQARERSATFWSGTPLPGDWSLPCPIAVDPAITGGRTEFQFENGEVFGWRMFVGGSPESITRDTLPHEVDHMVRASLVRHSMERWLDEGCASLWESEQSHAHLRQVASTVPVGCISEEWLSAEAYPQRARDLEVVYSVGFSLVEFLLSRGSPETLLAFQKDDADIASRLQRHYGLDVAELTSGWQLWRQRQQEHGFSCAACGCLMHGIVSETGGDVRPVLDIWTATWCGPCQKLKSDLQSRAGFRDQLKEAFLLRLHDVDQQPQLAAAQGISQLPTFVTEGERFSGYDAPGELLSRLGLRAAAPAGNENPETNTEAPLPPAPLPGDNFTGVPPTGPPATPSDSSTPTALTDKQSGAAAETERPTPRAVVSAPEENAGISRRRAVSIWPWVGAVGWLAEWLLPVSGVVATGGIGGFAVAGVWWLIRRGWHWFANGNSNEGRLDATSAPFPRELDEARQLLELRKTEGRVCILDALRGMFLDDELDKLAQANDAATVRITERLRAAIDARVDEVAPLTTSV